MAMNRNLSNRLVLTTGSAREAESDTGYIYVKFGVPPFLPGGSGVHSLRVNARFSAESRISVDFNRVEPQSFFDDMPTDRWDHLRLVTPSSDGIGLTRVELVHSDEQILDLQLASEHWLDQYYGKVLDLTNDMLNFKLSLVANTRYPVIRYAIQELGKTDGYKYGTGRNWCSEFASWCIRQAFEWHDVPSGNIGSDDLVEYFRGKGRAVSGADVRNGSYTLTQGDYLQVNAGEHSELFYSYVSARNGSEVAAPSSPSGTTWIRCVGGNESVGQPGPTAVHMNDRQLSSVDNVGRTN
jgi:hypothetical protein